MAAKKRRRVQPPKDDPTYVALWLIVDNALAETFRAHPGYLTNLGRQAAQVSILKRVVGHVAGEIKRGRVP